MDKGPAPEAEPPKGRPARKKQPAKSAATPRIDEDEPSEPGPAESREVVELKRGIERAVVMLEKGKQIPAFNLLKRLIK